ncbi:MULTISPECIES: ABC transporter permease [Niallia]|jgi:general nucleoside transport system permease protein|uniref:Sugar ABC transporter permease n=1 Tax=Niallia circulans TaxID=1397 RepID=A0AA91TUB4_NIACI|nr:ABC transporter permease [Niallia circulans]AYV71109.1 ABC transporter permease [Niallia circulans]NRG26942.1 ABC transporter permease [Niallia circulans]PAD84299.1 sugar ABC transporter permease [Niallia circulans]QJX61967.1 ABC transporter permease [Niallia circulans]UQZ73477.1 ABC transporter permease [Niallia circulans]
MGLMDVLLIVIPSSLLFAAPLIFTALGGNFSERAGVVNIGLEGLMVMGAFSSIVFNLTFADSLGAWTPWVSLLVAMVVGALFSILHAVASITFRADQTVSGVAINLLAAGLAMFLVKLIYDGKGQTGTIRYSFKKIDIPLLKDIPVIGDLFFSNTYWTSYLAIVVAIIVWFVMYKTPFGLRLRSVGEHPMAADTMGINVTKMRYVAVILSGAFGGIGGGVFAQSITNDFTHATISGQGFMALAALIFGKWNPLGAMGAAIFFGFAQSLSIVGSSLPFLENIPSVYLLIAPYVLTIVALTGFIGRADAPKASGVPYIKGSR